MNLENEFYYVGEDEPFAVICWYCGGSGTDDITWDGWDDDGLSDCPECDGQGLIYLDEGNE